MLIQNLPSASEQESSVEEFCGGRPVAKAKYRSCIPTVSNLLISVIQHKHLANHVISDIHKMEAQLERQEALAISDMSENLNIPNSECSIRDCLSKVQCSCGRSHRTEDILVRENEDGIRFHYCPLDEDLDGEGNENEDCADHLDFDIDCLLKGCNLKSEEIPYLMAEKPSASDCEGSDVDSSTLMIYAPVQNRQSSSEDETLQFLPEKGKGTPSLGRLDEKTMAAWAEESSDEYEYDVPQEKDLEMIEKYAMGEESDMEEFNETPGDINENKQLESLENDRSPENVQERVENVNHGVEEERDANSPNEHSEEKRFGIKNAEDKQQNASDVETTNGSALETKRESKNNPDDKYCPQSSDATKEKDSLGSKIENTTDDVIFKQLNVSTDAKEAVLGRSLDVEEKPDTAITATAIEDSNQVDVNHDPGTDDDIVADILTSLEERKREDQPHIPNVNSSNKNEKIIENHTTGFRAQEPERTLKAKNVLSMEPVAMNLARSSKNEETQHDLATALRFMTEVYHTKEENELYSETLSFTDVPLTDVTLSKVTAISDRDVLDEKRKGPKSVKLKSPSKFTSSFEPVPTEEMKTATRPRNKLTKFFKSFKNRLTKNV